MKLFMTNATAAKASGAASDWSYAGASIAEWAMVAIGIVALILLGRLLADVALRFPRPDPADAKFAKTLIQGVEQHSEVLEREFRTALRVPGVDDESGKSNLGATAAIAHIRHLRRLLRPPMAFIRHVRTLSLGDWPGYELSHAFANWAGTVEANDQLLDDMFREVTAAAATGQWAELRTQYAREERFMLDDMTQLAEQMSAVEKAAKPFLKKPTRHSESDEAHH